MTALMLSSACKTREKEYNAPIKKVVDNNTHFRDYASATSPDLEMSRTIAMSNAKERLAKNINSTMSGLTENYKKQLSVADRQKVGKIFETASAEFFTIKLGRVSTI